LKVCGNKGRRVSGRRYFNPRTCDSTARRELLPCSTT